MSGSNVQPPHRPAPSVCAPSGRPVSLPRATTAGPLMSTRTSSHRIERGIQHQDTKSRRSCWDRCLSNPVCLRAFVLKHFFVLFSRDRQLIGFVKDKVPFPNPRPTPPKRVALVSLAQNSNVSPTSRPLAVILSPPPSGAGETRTTATPPISEYTQSTVCASQKSVKNRPEGSVVDAASVEPAGLEDRRWQRLPRIGAFLRPSTSPTRLSSL